jgi:hypothetical protein
MDTITIIDLQVQYETLYDQHLESGGQTLLDNLLAFQRVIRFYTTEDEFEAYMASFLTKERKYDI